MKTAPTLRRMTAPAIKPGTRCECKCRHHDGHAIDNSDYCVRPPVRTVAVREPLFSIHDDDLSDVIVGYKAKTTRERAMCSPCAAFHEAKAGARPMARCDVCNELKPRDEVWLVAPAQAAGTETWACDKCREG